MANLNPKEPPNREESSRFRTPCSLQIPYKSDEAESIDGWGSLLDPTIEDVVNSFSSKFPAISDKKVKLVDECLFIGTFSNHRVTFGKCEVNGAHHSYVTLSKNIGVKSLQSELQWMETFASRRHESSSANFAHLLGLYKRSDGSVFAIFDSVQQQLKDYLYVKGNLQKMHERYLMCEGISKGLHFLHSFDPEIIHGAVTPESILVDTAGNPKLSDLSRAHKLESVSEQSLFGKVFSLFASTNPLQKLVDPHGCNSHSPFSESEYPYLAPEVIQKSSLSEESDIFSLGVVIMEVVSLSPPTPDGPVGDRDELLRRENDLERLRCSCECMESVITYCLKQEPDHRGNTNQVLNNIRTAKCAEGWHGEEAKSPSMDSGLGLSPQISKTSSSDPGSITGMVGFEAIEEEASEEMYMDSGMVVFEAIEEGVSEEVPNGSTGIGHVINEKQLDTAVNPKQEVFVPLSGKLSIYNGEFYESKHYSKSTMLEGVKGVFLCWLLDEDTSSISSSISTVSEADLFKFTMRESSSKNSISPNYLSKCEALSKNGHRNVCTFLGLFVEESCLGMRLALTLEDFFNVSLNEFISGDYSGNECITDSDDEGDGSVCKYNNNPMQVIQWSYELFDGLAHLHRLGISHKHLFGHMIRMSLTYTASSYQVKISNFMKNEDNFPSFRYQAPEYSRHKFQSGSDVWSAACNVVFMITRTHPWGMVTEEKVHTMLKAMTKPFDKKKQEEYFSQLINRKLLEKALHPYQSEAFLQLLRPIFTGVVRPPENKEEAVDGKVPYRPQALEICQQFFHYCKDGDKQYRLCLSAKSDIRLSIDTQLKFSVNCCSCEQSEALIYGPLGPLSKMCDSVSEKGISMKISIYQSVCGSMQVSRNGLKPVGPAVFFLTAEPLEAPIILKLPLYGQPCPSSSSSGKNTACQICLFKGTYQPQLDSYVFDVDCSDLIPPQQCGQVIPVPVHDKTLFRPFCRCSLVKSECPLFNYELIVFRAKRSAVMDSVRIEAVVSIKGKVWESVIQQQYPKEVWIADCSVFVTSWDVIYLKTSGNLNISGATSIRQREVKDIDCSPVELQDEIYKRTYPPRLTIQVPNGSPPFGELRLLPSDHEPASPLLQHTYGSRQEVELGGHSVSVTSERVKQILQQLNKFLHSKIVSNEIKEELFSKEVITFKVKEKMANQKSTEESNEVLYNHLYTTSTMKRLKDFCQVLKDTARDFEVHGEVAEELNGAILNVSKQI